MYNISFGFGTKLAISRVGYKVITPTVVFSEYLFYQQQRAKSKVDFDSFERRRAEEMRVGDCREE